MSEDPQVAGSGITSPSSCYASLLNLHSHLVDNDQLPSQVRDLLREWYQKDGMRPPPRAVDCLNLRDFRRPRYRPVSTYTVVAIRWKSRVYIPAEYRQWTMGI